MRNMVGIVCGVAFFCVLAWTLVLPAQPRKQGTQESVASQSQCPQCPLTKCSESESASETLLTPQCPPCLSKCNRHSREILEEDDSPSPRARIALPLTRLDGSQEDCPAVRRSLKYSPNCSEIGDAVWPLLITSVGGSGTKYMATLLKNLGFQVNHDNGVPGKDGAVSWVLGFNNDNFAYPGFVGRLPKKARFKKVLLQVRNPLSVINSRLAEGELRSEFIDRNTAVSREKFVYTPARSIEHWLSWNMHILRYSDWSFRLEDVDIAELCFQAGFGSRCPSREKIAEVKANLPQTTHHHKSKNGVDVMTWETLAEEAPLITELTMDFGSLLGYNLNSGIRFRPPRDGQRSSRKLQENPVGLEQMVEVKCIVDLCEVVRVYWGPIANATV